LSFLRRQESRKHWMPDQVRHDEVWLFTCRVNKIKQLTADNRQVVQ
jgi:hypothetical protein